MNEQKVYPVRLVFGGSNGMESILNIIFEKEDRSLKTIELNKASWQNLLSFEDASEGIVIYENTGLFGKSKLTKIILPKNIYVR